MRVIGSAEVERVLDFPRLIAALRAAFAAPAGVPRRSVYALSASDGSFANDGSPGGASKHPAGDRAKDAFAVLPAWNEELIGLKAFTYLPDNAAHDRPVLHSQILLFDRRTGAPRALVDGPSVTNWRTAAVAALAADYLARADANRLLFCGTGHLAPYMILAHASVRTYQSIGVWGRNPPGIERTIEQVRARRPDLQIKPVEDLARAVLEAHVISCATGAREPLIHGEWVQPGTHADFFGNHERDARECDTALVARARVYVDNRANVLNEAGEILIPMAEGRITKSHIAGELADLCAGRVRGRATDHLASEEVTLFKSVGTALADLAAAGIVLDASETGT